MDIYQQLLRELSEIEGDPEILLDEPMSRHTTFRIGGPADVFVSPRDEKQTAEVLGAVRRSGLPFFILGNGSNLLVSDSGFRGVVIRIYRNMSDINVNGEEICAGAGALLSAIAAAARSAELTGFEFASGIPGTLGGAVVMNAGAYGGEMKDVLACARVLTPQGEIKTLALPELKLGYRTSIIKEEDLVVLSAVMRFEKGDAAAIRDKMQDLQQRRVTKQPLEFPSAGSTFKRPEGYFAGKLIEDAGLRGFAVGGAKVSDKHCGFVINADHATADDVMRLIQQVKGRVYESSGVRLEPEVRFLGDF
ncbi:MAG: UDP-N-acetylmuramate dehydrogenase [Blautia sp.]|nr:UDP-N-acetylmuramate dehydrogenase [Blautia sp.]